MTAADTAANWLVFMAGCKGESQATAFHREPRKQGFFQEMGDPVRAGAGIAGKFRLALPIRDRIPIRAA